MRGRAIYRLPFAKECVTVAGEVISLNPTMVTKEISGFFIRPFISNDTEYAVYIKAEEVATYGCCEVPDLDGFEIPDNSEFEAEDLSKEDHDNYVDHFKQCIAEGQLKKGVLVRNINKSTENTMDPLSLFKKACEEYPRMMVSLFSTPVSGTWLICSPQILLEKVSKEIYHTTAIAGAKPLADIDKEWPKRVLEDIDDVKDDIVKTLNTFSYNIKVEGPKTIRAGNLLHLKYDIIFELVFPRAFGVIGRILHPSPVACGIPRDIAYQMIIDLNSYNIQYRHYSGGTFGPIAVGDDTKLFVSLHSMLIHSKHKTTIYDCLSIYENSDADEKWIETKEKLDSMLKLINACK